ncbi:MAG TPA: hypothetical protein VEZ11_08785 [Thermoanaerobaculia bacterium]|nr:hypothetical protein [Thermoanaerobaculia bacterium]
MTAAGDQANFPTMIIPRGTEIRVNAAGQLSIKTPGNLVIQNSGNYSELESTNGSIRIEENVTVEAVSIRAAQACFIQGTVTAWKVNAKRIALEDKARAFIMLQESEQLELSRTSRLVGNFANEKELYLMMGKFTPQLKELPGAVDLASHSTLPEVRQPAAVIAPPAFTQTDPADHMRSATALLEREVMRTDLEPHEMEALRELLFALRERNTQRIAMIYREALAEVSKPTDSLREVHEHLEAYLRK